MQSLRSLWSVSCAVALASFASTAHSIIIAQDNFTYADGGLVGQKGGVGLNANNGWNSAWTNAPTGASADWQVVGGQVTTPGAVPADSYARRAIKENLGLQTYYFGFNLFIPEVPENPSYAGLFLSPLATLPHTNPDAQLYVQYTPLGSGSNLFLRGNLGNSGSVAGATPLSFGVEYRVIGRLQFDGTLGNNTILTAWVFPSTNYITESSTPYLVRSNNVITLGTTLGNEFLFLYRESVDSSVYQFDEFILATTFIEAIPEPSAAVMIGLGLAGLFLRRRRQTRNG